MPQPLYSIDALRAIERRAGAGDDTRLMERAGQAAWQALLATWPDAHRIVVVCGPGDNGGDGLVLARHAQEAGRDVRVVRHAQHVPRTAAGKAVQARLVAARGRVEVFEGALPPCDLLVDALLGIGLSRTPDAAVRALLDAMNAHGAPVLALDVPSGVDAASGYAHPGAVRATRTLEFLLPKAGLRTGAARRHVGRLSCAALDVHDADGASAQALHVSDLPAFLPPRAIDSHKGLHGRVLCIGGDRGHGGAILLAAEGALRAGAGLVEIETRARHVAPALVRVPEAMADATGDPTALAARIARADACVVGPGLGQGPWAHAHLAAARTHGSALVFDADALNLLADDPAPALPPDTVLTPHPGEAARLLGCETRDVQRNRFLAARRLVDRYHCVVVLKGAGTVVAAPNAVPRVIDAGNAGMAVGGMGDVLAGVIGALRAQRLAAFDAACAGALLHAVAGDAAALHGQRGLLPRDLFGPLRAAANP